MTREERVIDRFARDICWAEFHIPILAGCTKQQYWEKVTENNKENFKCEARRFLFLVQRLGLKRIETTPRRPQGNHAMSPKKSADLLREVEVSDGINVIIGDRAVAIFPMECRAQVEHLIESINRIHRRRLKEATP
jgi:hypothetical protein